MTIYLVDGDQWQIMDISCIDNRREYWMGEKASYKFLELSKSHEIFYPKIPRLCGFCCLDRSMRYTFDTKDIYIYIWDIWWKTVFFYCLFLFFRVHTSFPSIIDNMSMTETGVDPVNAILVPSLLLPPIAYYSAPSAELSHLGLWRLPFYRELSLPLNCFTRVFLFRISRPIDTCCAYQSPPIIYLRIVSRWHIIPKRLTVVSFFFKEDHRS